MPGTPLAKISLAEISMEVASGEVVALVGPTGSGKSTLLQHMNGIYTPDSGTLRVLDYDLSDPKVNLTALRREVGLVLQNPEQQIFERYVGDDVSFGPRMAGLSGRELTRRVRWAMESVGLEFDGFKDRPTFALSGGERRKVGLAGVVALKPKILLLDEPTAGLDPQAHDEMLGHLAALHDSGMTLVMATHCMDDVAALAGRVIVLKRGRVAMHGTVREVFSRAADLEMLGLELPSAAAILHELSLQGVATESGVLNLSEAEEAILTAMGKR
jgi:energy-coupling factor transport system ATP-binding protein